MPNETTQDQTIHAVGKTAVDWAVVKRGFMLTPGKVYLNSGSFSALPREVFEAQVRLMEEAEGNPTREGIGRGFAALWRVQGLVADYLGCDAHDLILHTNVTQALNQALWTMPWRTGTELLISNHEYGAVANAARELARRNGMSLRVFDLPLQPESEEEIIAAVLDALREETAGVIVSHVTCSTGMRVPVERIATALRSRGVLSIVDGAHAPGLVDVKLGGTDIDFYGGNLHKWVLGPKGTGFLYSARRHHEAMKPHVVGWGATQDDKRPIHDQFEPLRERFQYVFRRVGCHDYAPMLALEATLAYRARIGEEAIRARVAELVGYVRRRVGEAIDLEMMSPREELNVGLVTLRTPKGRTARPIVERVYQRYGVTLAAADYPEPVGSVRFSPHICNDERDIDAGVEALRGGLAEG